MQLVSRFDRYFGRLIQNWPSDWRPAMRAASFAGYQLLPLVLVILAAIALTDHRPRLLVAAVLAGSLTTLSLILKQFTHRPRPQVIELSHWRIDSYSFPSGHSFGSLVCYGLAAYLIGQPVTVAVAGLLILTVGLSRVYLGVHYPTDVLGGWTLGGLSLWLIIELTSLR